MPFCFDRQLKSGSNYRQIDCILNAPQQFKIEICLELEDEFIRLIRWHRT